MTGRIAFDALGGFDPNILFAEDYYLSKQVKRNKFRLVRGGVYTSNRRFRKMGHAPAAQLFLQNRIEFLETKIFSARPQILGIVRLHPARSRVCRELKRYWKQCRKHFRA